jgi:hypothetical protein
MLDKMQNLLGWFPYNYYKNSTPTIIDFLQRLQNTILFLKM